MKKILFLFLFLTLFFQNSLNARNTKFYTGSFYSGIIKFKFMEYELPNGEWELYTKYFDAFDELLSVRFECMSFIQNENNTIKATYRLCEINLGGLAPNEIGSFFASELKKGKYDSCILRPEYFYTNLYTRGGASNCFRTRHIDVHKEVYFPDDPEDAGGVVRLEKYLNSNGLVLPKTMLITSSWIGVPLVKDKFIDITYSINPVFILMSE